MQVQPEARRDRFREFWSKRDELKNHYRHLISKGQRTDVFIAADADLVTNMVFGFVESTATWYEQSGAWAPQTTFDTVAEFILRALTGDADSASRARSAAVPFHRTLESKRAERTLTRIIVLGSSSS